MSDDTRRSTDEIRAGLMRRAWEGVSKHTPDQMAALIKEREMMGRLMPAGHAEALAQIDRSEPRTVLMLNRLAEEEAKERSRESGALVTPRRWTGKNPEPQ